jgi:hypothetical protein
MKARQRDTLGVSIWKAEAGDRIEVATQDLQAALT